MDWKTLPKVELHFHIDCSLSFEAVSRLAPGVTREEYEREYTAPSRCTNLADFLIRAPKGFLLMQTEEALQLVADDVVQQLAADGVIYAELRFAPLLHNERGLSPHRVVEILDRCVDRLIRETGVETRLILCTLRHFTAEQSMATAHLVEDFRASRVVALDIAGDEAGYPLAPHINAYRYARDHGLFRTAHAGEGLGSESVWETLRELEPQRVGHGTRSYEDPELVAHLVRERIHLELCPSSNVQIIPSLHTMAHHPIDALYRAGVSLNVNTDSRMLTPTTMTQEYEHLARVFRWGSEEFLRANQMGIRAAFVDSQTKQKLEARLRDAYANVAAR